MSFLSKSFKCNFTQVPNEIINDKNVSLKAKGLYLYMVSKPDDWEFSYRGMASQLKEGIDSILSTIDELIKLGYMEKIKNRSSNGLQLANDYVMHEKPCFPSGSENPNWINRIGKTESENPYTSNTKQTNTKKEIKKKTSSNEDEKKISFNLFREDFISKHKDGFRLSDCKPWSSETVFKISDDNMIFNTVSNSLISKDEAFVIWSYLYNKYKNKG